MRNTVQPDRPQMTIQYGVEKIRLAITKARIQTHTHNMYSNTYLFFAAKMVTRRRFVCYFYTYINCLVFVTFCGGNLSALQTLR